MNKSLVSYVIFTCIVVVACGRGCQKDPVIPDDDFPATPSPTSTSKSKGTEVPSPTHTPTPTLMPTMAIKTFVVPKSATLGDTFEVRAFVNSVEILDVYADNYRLGTMGWSSQCNCKTLMIKLNTAGERSIRFLSGKTELASEIILIEAE